MEEAPRPPKSQKMGSSRKYLPETSTTALPDSLTVGGNTSPMVPR